MSPVAQQLAALALWFSGALLWTALPGDAGTGSCQLTFPDGMQLDVGSLPAGSQEISFPVRNDGAQIVRVKEVSGSCTCMTIGFPDNLLFPGETKTCTVKLNVQPGAEQTGAVFIQTSTPVPERYALFIAYRGVQQDRLELAGPPPLQRLEPDQLAEFQLECSWESTEEIAADALVDWRISEPRGITLLGHREIRESPNTLRSIASLQADAHALSSAEARLEVRVGLPVRAMTSSRITIPVMPSLTLEPDVVLVTRPEEFQRELLARVQIGMADGWRIDGVDSPDWLHAEVEEQQLLLRPTGTPGEKRGVYTVRLASSNAEGLRSERAVQIVLDMENER